MFPGFATRLLKEIRHNYKEKFFSKKEGKFIKIKIEVIDSPRRKFSVFIGATILANLYNNEKFEQEYWISKKEWEEVGPDIILKKCPNLIL